MRIRRNKLPDPDLIGNAGSFFKNPVVDRELFLRLQERYPDIPHYPADNGVKPAAGWKGFKRGNYGVHDCQALVLVSYGAFGTDSLQLSREIQADVHEKFGVELESELNILS
ncbi:hypothetical protein [Methylocaldum szegediense]|jgi:UDP-N-acetylmuramate dehydrogenase|uniref:hypothetical protein n=1 Tax=Methylocaldum szegediense TaxID=73780 RepID=UPI0003F8C4BD|nr:hypothetical protein [Methylocaldum szegediense]